MRPSRPWVSDLRSCGVFMTELPPAVLIAGWSENGWLSGGHAVRMAMELGTCRHEDPQELRSN